MRKGTIGSRVTLGNHVWTVWSEAPGVSCFWLSRRDDEGKAMFIKARKSREEWREVNDGEQQD